MSALHDLIYCCSKDFNDQIKQINHIDKIEQEGDKLQNILDL